MLPTYSKLALAPIILLAICLTLLSLNFVRPVNCWALCGEPDLAACAVGTCRFGDQRAGLPLPFMVDAPGGGSPTNGWGILGAEDLPDPFVFILDVLFYSLLLWLIRYIARVVRGKTAMKLLAILLPSVALLAGLIAGFFLYQPFLNR
jgi:hypothetical protein